MEVAHDAGTPPAPTLHGTAVVLRPAGAEDLPTLVDILDEPGVAAWWGQGDVVRWWRDGDATRVRESLLGSDGRAFAIVVDGVVAGLVQWWEEDDPDYRHAGIDIFLGSDHQGRGLGVDAVRTMARHLLEDRGHHRLTIDPAAANARAIAAYRRVGFRPVGVMRRYERTPEGGWRDGLLMDLLAGELT